MKFYVYIKNGRIQKGTNPDFIADLEEVTTNAGHTPDNRVSVGDYLNADGTYQPLWLVTCCEILGKDLNAFVYWEA